MKIIRKLWHYSAGWKRSLVLLALACGLGAYLEIRIPQLMSDVLDALGASEPLQSVARSCGMIGVFALLLVAQGVGEGYFVSLWSAGVTKNLGNALFTRVLALESADADRFGAATVLTRLTTDVTSLRRSLQMVGNLLKCPLLILFSTVAAIRIHRGLSLIFLIAVPLFAVLLALIITASRRHYHRMLARYDEMNQTLSESIGGMRTVKAYAREGRQAGVFRGIAVALRRESVAAEKLAAMNNPVSKLMVNLAVLALVWLGGRQVIRESLSVGDLFCLITYTNQILAQALIISMILVPLMSSQVSLGRILEVLEWPGEGAAGAAQAVPDGSVSFRDVSFSYGDGDAADPLMAGLSFDVADGEFLGIIGPSGCGKTTLVKLLMGLYAPTGGSVIIGGRDSRDYAREALRGAFAYVPQRTWLFTGSIRDNLCAGMGPVDEGTLDAACRDACILDYVRAQPEGYDAAVAEGGGNLSGGQRQRLCLARALARPAPILVMDNMTSALDRITEEQVCRNLREHRGRMTRIVVSDRISTIRDADRILVLDRGRIVGLGTHGALLESCALYREMDRSQRRQVSDV